MILENEIRQLKIELQEVYKKVASRDDDMEVLKDEVLYYKAEC